MPKLKSKLKKQSEWEIISEDISMAQNGGNTGYQWSNQQTPFNYTLATPKYVNVSRTESNRKLTQKEIDQLAKYTAEQNQLKKEQEYNQRKQAIQQSIEAQNQPLTINNLRTQTQATGDKMSLAMNSRFGNPKEYPILSGYMDALDFINPGKFIGDMATGLGALPYNVREGNYGQAALSLAAPLATGALAGLGANSTKQFVNNLANPLAGIERPKTDKLTFSTHVNTPTQSNFGSIYTLNPLTLLGEKLPEQAYRKIGNSAGLQDIIESGVIRAKNQKGYGTPYFAPNTTWEGYNGVYAVGYQPNVKAGEYLQRASKSNPHRGVVPANQKGVMESIPFNEQTTLYRRMPFTSAYKTVPKEYLQNPSAYLLTNPHLADLQNLSEQGLKYTGYGITAHDIYVDEKDRWFPIIKNKAQDLLRQKKSGGKVKSKSSDWEIIE